MKAFARILTAAVLSALPFLASATPAGNAADFQPAFEISVPDGEDGVVEISGEIGLLPAPDEDSLSKLAVEGGPERLRRRTRCPST